MARRLVIIGGDAAGMSAAAQARRMTSAGELEIVAFERGSRTSYAACGLPYLVGGLVETPELLIARTPEQHRANGIDVRIHHEVTAIDAKASTVTVRDLDTGREAVEHYDELLIGTGASGIAPPWPGIDAEGVLQLRTLDDAADVERRLGAGARRAVVVGAGYIGLEVAEALLERGLDVTVVERLDAPMGAVLDADMAAHVADAMRAAGIDLRLGTAVTGFTAVDGRVTAVETAAGPVAADLVVIGLGVRPNVDLARAAGIGVGEAGGIIVDDHLRTGTPHVWAAGDCVESRHRITGRSVVVALGTHANKQGRVAGTNIAGGDATFAGVLGTAITKFRNLEIGRTGLTEAGGRGRGVRRGRRDHRGIEPGALLPGRAADADQDRGRAPDGSVARRADRWRRGRGQAHRRAGHGAVERHDRGGGGRHGPLLRAAVLAGLGPGAVGGGQGRVEGLSPI